MINDLIDGTKIQQDFIKWKKTNTCSEDGKIRRGYWYGFLKSYIHEMIGAGVAEPLYEPDWMDKKDQIVEEQKLFGCKVFHRLLLSNMSIVCYKVGGSISIKREGH